MQGDAYRELALRCRQRKLRLRLCGDRDHIRFDHVTPRNDLERLDICRKNGDLLVRVSLKDHTFDSAAEVALIALELAAPPKRKRKGAA